MDFIDSRFLLFRFLETPKVQISEVIIKDLFLNFG
jgi:hypothetical protein